jgi:uncharacterized protein (DUF697 family)
MFVILILHHQHKKHKSMNVLHHFNVASQVSNILKTFSDNMDQEEKQLRANDIIKNHVGFAASAGLLPFPMADLAAVTAVQLNMLRQLAKLYNVSFTENLGKNFITAIAGSGLARLGASLIKAIPGVGTVIGELSMAAMSGGSTYALGNVFSNHFAKGGTFEDFDLTKSKKVYEEELKKGKAVVNEVVKKEEKPEDVVSKLTKLSQLRDAGILTEDEFLQMKTKLLADF